MLQTARSNRALAWAVPIGAEAAALGRSIAFAWAIGPEELGRAMMLALVVRLVEMASDVGLDRLLLQAPDGNSSRLQVGLHGVAVLRGVVSALAIVAVTPALFAFFSDGPRPTAYLALAAIPLIRGAAHLDYRRAERFFDYRKMAQVEGGATLAMLLSVPLALWVFGDHRAMGVVLIAHAVNFTLLSHLVADRPYSLRLCLPTLRRSWRFGAPLILNALLLFITFYADRLIVARAYDWTSLAIYGVALQLALLPAQIVGRAAASLVLPTLRVSLATRNHKAVWRRIRATHMLLSGGIGLGFALAAPLLIGFVYGPALRPEAGLGFAFAFAAAFRVLRTPYSQLAIASGRTADPARANVFRALSVIPAAGFAAMGFPLTAIGAAAALGEAAATFRAWRLAASSHETIQMRQVPA
jgi:O-antigen/teichoic acid export membrane protein